MKDNSFSMAMDKIVGEHQAECKREMELQARREMFRQIRRAFVFLLVSAALLFALVNHKALTELVMARLNNHSAVNPAADSATGKTAAALQGAQENAAARDKLIDQISK